MIFVSGGHHLPKEMEPVAEQIGEQLAHAGWLYRGGYEEPGLIHMDIGVMMANGKREIFIPWQGFNTGMHKRNGVLVCHCLPNHIQAIEYAQQAYPTFKQEMDSIQMYWVRNMYLLLGEKLDTPADVVIYYQEGDTTSKTGSEYLVGAAQSIGIPCFNIENQEGMDALTEFVTEKM